ncbi:MAG: mRNA-degrading endonuclease [bacterium]|nr:mRNA-degrading endonuclease [bacterium]MCP4798421.1 mRNA-degrading endonuclease [bacterium]
MPRYVPEKGDFVIASFTPQSGHEQRGRRPAIVVSNKLFNKATGMTIVCPVTNAERYSPFHVPVVDAVSLSGKIMVEQVKSIDFKSRKMQFVEKATSEVLDEVLGILDACIY